MIARPPAKTLLVALLLGTLAAVAPGALFAQTTITVGLPQDRSLAFMDAEGIPHGIFVDILQYIASREGWLVRYVPCTLRQCLGRLERGKVDLLLDVAYSEERAARMGFSEESILVNWGVVYSRDDLGIQTILELRGKTLAVMSGRIC